MNKQLCVIMSLYKNDKLEYLQLAVESILKQSYSKFDFYIQFDGAVKQECEHYLESLNDDRIKIFKRNENKGLAHSLNDLLKIVLPQKYEYIARMDADDISLIDRFKKQISFLEKNKEVDIVGGAISEIDEFGKLKNKIINYPLTHTCCLIFFRKRDPLAHPAVMFRKTFFEKAGLYSEKHKKNQDTFLWHAGFKHGCIFANIDEVVLKFRVTINLFKRRGHLVNAFKFLIARIKVNHSLKYGLIGDLYTIAYFFLLISPSIIKKIAYKKLR